MHFNESVVFFFAFNWEHSFFFLTIWSSHCFFEPSVFERTRNEHSPGIFDHTPNSRFKNWGWTKNKCFACYKKKGFYLYKKTRVLPLQKNKGFAFTKKQWFLFVVLPKKTKCFLCHQVFLNNTMFVFLVWTFFLFFVPNKKETHWHFEKFQQKNMQIT